MKSDRYAYQQARKSGIGVQIYVGTNRFALLKGEAHQIYSPLRLSTPASSQVQGTVSKFSRLVQFAERAFTSHNYNTLRGGVHINVYNLQTIYRCIHPTAGICRHRHGISDHDILL